VIAFTDGDCLTWYIMQSAVTLASLSAPQSHCSMRFEITVLQLKEKLDKGERVRLIDVREPFEHEYSNIGGTLMPLNQLRRRFKELDSEEEIVLYCHRGNRSAYAANFLAQRGFKKVKTLVGGINGWSEKIDPSLPRY